jgi:hypothetical protein
MIGDPEPFTSTGTGGNRTEFRRSKKLDSVLGRMRQLRTKNSAEEESSSSRFAIDQRKRNSKEEQAVSSRGAQESKFLEDRRQELYLEPRTLGVTSRDSASSEEDEPREDQMPDHAQDRIYRITDSKEPRREESMLSKVPSSSWRMKSSARASEKIESSKIASPESIQAKSYHRCHHNVSLGQSRDLGRPSSKKGGAIQSIRRLEGKPTMKKKVYFDGMEQEPMIRKQNPNAHGEHEYHSMNQIISRSSSSDDSTSNNNSESSSSQDSSMPKCSTKNGKPVFFQFRALEVCKENIPYLLFYKDDDHQFFSERASNFVLGFVDQLRSYEGFPATLKDNANENEDSDDSSSNLSDSESTVETYDHGGIVTGENPKHDYNIHPAKGLAKNMMRNDSFPDHLDAHQKELFAKIKEFQGRKHVRRQLLGFSLAPSSLSDSSIDDTLLRGGSTKLGLKSSDESDTTEKATTTRLNISHSAIKSRREALDRNDKALENDSTPKRFSQPHAPQEIDVGRKFVPSKRFFSSAKSSSVGESGNDTDYLISKIETVVQNLIKSGKIDGHLTEGKASGLHKRTLQENTAELIRNLAILRSRRSREIDHNSKGSNSGFRSEIPSQSFRSPVNIKTRNASRVSGNMYADNNIAHLRAKRDKAAMAIRNETQRLLGLAVLKAPQNPISPLSPLRKKAFATHQHERNVQSPMASTQLQETVGVDTRQQSCLQTSSQNMRMDDHMAEGGSDYTSDRLERIKSVIDELRALQSSH